MTDASAQRGDRHRLARVALALYLPALFTATHWPQLRLPAGPIERPDLLVHVGAFGLLAFLVQRAHVFGRARGTRNTLIAGAASLAYAAFDEITQAIPALRRQAVIDDFLANALGVFLGVSAGALVGAFRARNGGGVEGGERA